MRVNTVANFYQYNKNINFKNNEPLKRVFSEEEKWITYQDILLGCLANMQHGDVLIYGGEDEKNKEELKNNIKKFGAPITNIYTINIPSFAFEPAFMIYNEHGKNKLLRTNSWYDAMLYRKENFSFAINYPQNREIEIEEGDSLYVKELEFDQDIHFSYKDTLDKETAFSKVKKETLKPQPDDLRIYNSAILAQLPNVKKSKSTKNIFFKDIGGQDSNIKELEMGLIFPLKYPEFFEGARINKGILLYGPPRCGKTLMAIAAANETNANYMSFSANDLTDALVGKSEENWREAFSDAIKKQPTVIFIDEFDSIGQKRSSHDPTHRNDLVNQLLTLMSDLEKSDDQVFIIAATNRKDLLDPAFISSGRFGLQLEVNLPDEEGVKQIFDIHSKNKPLSKNIDKDKLCKIMYENHFNGSDVAESFEVGRLMSFIRLGLYDKMKHGTITKNDIQSFEISQEDLENGINKLINQKNDIKKGG